MTKRILLWFISIFYFFSLPAQNFTLKANLPSIIFNNLSLSGEYGLTENKSLSLYAGFHYPRGFIFPAPDIRQWRSNLWGYFINPEFRFYLNHNSSHGFYLAPYLRFSQLSTKWKGKISYDSINLVDYTVYLKFTEIGPGIQPGYNFKLNDRLCLDFAFLGLRFSWFDLKGKFVGLLNEQAILETIGIDVLNKNGLFGLGQLIFSFINNKATIHLPFGFVMLRTSLSIGFTF